MSGHGAPGTKPWAASCAPDVPTFAFSAENQPEVEKIVARYPAARKASAVLPLLHLAQAQHGGWLPKAALDHVAELLGMPAGAKPMAVLCLGPVTEFYPAPMLVLEDWAEQRPLSEMLYENHWGERP